MMEFVKTCLLTFLTLTVYGCLSEKDDMFLKTSCTVGCRKYFNITMPNFELSSKNMINVTVTKRYVKGKINVYVMYRRKYVNWIKHNFGDKPALYGTYHVLPSVAEAQQWVLRKRCKIGTLCGSDGDCWGSSASVCADDSTNTWVEERYFKWEGLSWTASFRETCAMDWECSMKHLTLDVLVTESGAPFIDVGDGPVVIFNDGNPHTINKEGYTIFYQDSFSIREAVGTLQCSVGDSTLYCEEAKENGHSSFITLPAKGGCKLSGTIQYCLEGEAIENVASSMSNMLAGIDDLKQLDDAVKVLSTIVAHNFYVISKDRYETASLLTKIFSNLIDTNPGLFNGIIGEKSYARRMEKSIFEVCPCNSEMGCLERESHYDNIKFCLPTNASVIQFPLLQDNGRIELINEIDTNYIGKRLSPIIDHLEAQFGKDHLYNNLDSVSEVTKGIDSLFSPWSLIKEWAGVVALVICLVLLVKR